MIKFDLEKALAGEKVIRRSNKEVTQLTVFEISDGHLVCGVIDGMLHTNLHKGDLFMAPKKLSGFVNVYGCGATSSVHSCKLKADEWAENTCKTRVACIDLSQFEEGTGYEYR